MASTSRRPWHIGICIIPKVFFGIVQSQVLHPLIITIIIFFFFLLLALIMPRVGVIRRAHRRVVRGVCRMGVREPRSARLWTWATQPSPSPTASGCFQECSNCYIVNFLFEPQPKVFGVLLLLIKSKGETPSRMKTREGRGKWEKKEENAGGLVVGKEYD